MAELFDRDGIARNFKTERCASCLQRVRMAMVGDREVTFDVTPTRGFTMKAGGRGGAGKPTRAVVTDIYHLHHCPRRS